MPLLAEAGGPVSRFEPLPKFLALALVLVTSPGGVRDVLRRSDGLTERCQIHQEIRNVAGDNLFVLSNGYRSAPELQTGYLTVSIAEREKIVRLPSDTFRVLLQKARFELGAMMVRS